MDEWDIAELEDEQHEKGHTCPNDTICMICDILCEENEAPARNEPCGWSYWDEQHETEEGYELDIIWTQWGDCPGTFTTLN